MCTRKVAGTKGESALLRDLLSRVNRTPRNLTVSQWTCTIAWGCVLRGLRWSLLRYLVEHATESWVEAPGNSIRASNSFNFKSLTGYLTNRCSSS